MYKNMYTLYIIRNNYILCQIHISNNKSSQSSRNSMADSILSSENSILSSENSILSSEDSILSSEDSILSEARLIRLHLSFMSSRRVNRDTMSVWKTKPTLSGLSQIRHFPRLQISVIRLMICIKKLSHHGNADSPR
jgi:hypothetical protein